MYFEDGAIIKGVLRSMYGLELLNQSNLILLIRFLQTFTRKSMMLIIMRTSLCALERQKGRTYVCATMDMLR